jgi:hypothetical protein
VPLFIGSKLVLSVRVHPIGPIDRVGEGAHT